MRVLHDLGGKILLKSRMRPFRATTKHAEPFGEFDIIYASINASVCSDTTNRPPTAG